MTNVRGANLGLNKATHDIQAGIENGIGIYRWNIVHPDAANWNWIDYLPWLENQVNDIKLEPTKCRKVVCLFSPPGGSQFIDSENRTQFKEAWTYIAKELRGDESVWGYDLVNEPIANARVWRHLAERTSSIIQSIEPSRRVIVTSRHGSPFNLADSYPIEGVKFYTCHIYDSMYYTHQGVSSEYPYPRAYRPKEVLKGLKKVREWQKEHKVKIFIGEFSAARWAPDCEKWLKEVTDFLNDVDWHWCYHAWRESHVWDLEFSDTYCFPDASCAGERKVTPRLEVMRKAWKR